MTLEERAGAVASFGFTPRQARFLTTVMLHAGVCVQRQYAHFAGIANGQLTRDFFARLVRDRIATAYPCWRGAARIYHVHHKALYRAIGEPDNRHRRRLIISRATDRLMVLDAVLRAPDTAWLGSERDKVTGCVHRLGVELADLPQLTFEAGGERTVRYFPAKLPIAIAGPELTLLFVAADTDGGAFRGFLHAHRPLIERVPRGRLRLAVPRALAASPRAHAGVATAFFAPPLRPAVWEEFRWYCQTRLRAERASSTLAPADQARFLAAKRAFSSSRFYAVYRDWVTRGEPAFASVLAHRLHDLWRRGDWRIEIDVLPHAYEHLSPSLAIA